MADDQVAAGRAVAELVAVASAALGRQLGDAAVVSAGSGRSTVLRCADPGCEDPGRRTVVVKSYPSADEGPGSFAAEAAGLELATGSGLSPDLLAADADRLVVVMTDLGAGQSMADVLLGDSAAAARLALTDWAEACGRLSAAASGRRAEFERLRAGYLQGRPDESYLGGLGDRIRGAGRRASAELGVRLAAGLDAELAELAVLADGDVLGDGDGLAASDGYAVFSPGDLCPDNNLLTAGGLRFVDFEAAGFHSVFLDAAYLRMPFSTCWCVFRLPPDLRAEAEAAYRTQVCRIWPELAEPAVWERGVLRGAAVWTMSSMWWLLGRAMAGDESMEPEARAAPRTRQLVRYRWQSLLAELEAAAELPALAELLRAAVAATAGWQVPELPLYPAFR